MSVYEVWFMFAAPTSCLYGEFRLKVRSVQQQCLLPVIMKSSSHFLHGGDADRSRASSSSFPLGLFLFGFSTIFRVQILKLCSLLVTTCH